MTTRVESKVWNAFADRSQARISSNERAWVEFIRLMSRDTDPQPTLALVQRLRTLFTE